KSSISRRSARGWQRLGFRRPAQGRVSRFFSGFMFASGRQFHYDSTHSRWNAHGNLDQPTGPPPPQPGRGVLAPPQRPLPAPDPALAAARPRPGGGRRRPDSRDPDRRLPGGGRVRAAADGLVPQMAPDHHRLPPAGLLPSAAGGAAPAGRGAGGGPVGST